MTTDTETPSTFNEYREAYVQMKAERDTLQSVAMAESANRRELAEAVIGYFETGNGLDSIRELAEGMTK